MHQIEMVHLMCNLLDHAKHDGFQVIGTYTEGTDGILVEIRRPGTNGNEYIELRLREQRTGDGN